MEIQGNNMYEVNQQLSAQEKPLSSGRRKIRQEQLRLWFRDNIDHYAMLLCHEQRDYTVFNVIESPAEAAAILFECLDNRGKIISIDRTEDEQSWEIWLRISDDEENQKDYCYYLFSYDAAVIEC